MSGIGQLSSTVFENSLGAALNAAREMSGIALSVTSWMAQSCSSERPLSEWHTYNMTARGLVERPKILPYWTVRTRTADRLNDKKISTLTSTEVVYFPDKSAQKTLTEDVVNDLRRAARVDVC
jgi:hypothetical protein